MALNLERVGKVWGPYEFNYNERDLIIYALGIGFGKENLEYVYEGAKDFKAFPTYGVILPSNAGAEAFLSTKANFAMVVHGEQTLEMHNPLPRSATISTTAVIEGIYDKGSGALIVMRFDSKDKNGKPLCSNWSSAFVRGAGGFGGAVQPKKEIPAIPQRNPDFVFEAQTVVNQAALYRVSGDRNPLHIDPAVAKAVGFKEPILHGLCTYGVICRRFVREVFQGDCGKLKSYSARFSSPVIPGESLQTKVWQARPHLFLLEVYNAKGEAVIRNGVIESK
ncbi:MAG: MaoC family dehydratase N-terminal domain-containing protein [Deltaproteobacteria bacterium]|nr:MaoC family dehydratase N-terminal domain-containing protein [Deltaproteobacteria bacterium]